MSKWKESSKEPQKRTWLNGDYKVREGRVLAPGTGMARQKTIFHCYYKDGYIAQTDTLKDAQDACHQHQLPKE